MQKSRIMISENKTINLYEGVQNYIDSIVWMILKIKLNKN